MRTKVALISFVICVFFSVGCTHKPTKEIRVIAPNYSYQNASNIVVKNKNL